MGSTAGTTTNDLPTFEDRLGTVTPGYPYGAAIGNPAANDQPDFATYTRDGSTGLDYAVSRHYYAGLERFVEVDTSTAGATEEVPAGQNRYSYVEGDPVNAFDPEGRFLNLPDYGPSCGYYLGFMLDGSWDCSNDALAGWLAGPLIPAAALLGRSLTQGNGAPASASPSCDLQLFSQHAGSIFDPALHTYVGLTGRINGIIGPETFLESGPIDKTTKKDPAGKDATLYNSWNNKLLETSPGAHYYNSTPSSLEWESGFSTSECGANMSVYINDIRYPNNTVNYSFPYPNSNSFTYTLLSMSGVSLPLIKNLALLVAAPGWGVYLPW